MLNVEPNLSRKFLRACQKGNLAEIQRLVLENDIKDWSVIRHGPSGDSPLHFAAREGHLEIVRYLCGTWIEQKCAIDVVNLEMKTALHEASQFSKSAVVEYLIEKGLRCSILVVYIYDISSFNISIASQNSHVFTVVNVH